MSEPGVGGRAASILVSNAITSGSSPHRRGLLPTIITDLVGHQVETHVNPREGIAIDAHSVVFSHSKLAILYNLCISYFKLYLIFPDSSLYHLSVLLVAANPLKSQSPVWE